MTYAEMIWESFNARIRNMPAPNPDLALSPEDIAVTAWQYNSLAFGMKGHEQKHPDLHKITACLYGSKGMIRYGYLLRVPEKPKHYRLGKKPPPSNSCGGKMPGSTNAVLIQKTLERLTLTNAARQMQAGNANNLTVLDAMEFFGCKRRSELPKKASTVQAVLLHARSRADVNQQCVNFLSGVVSLLEKFTERVKP